MPSRFANSDEHGGQRKIATIQRKIATIIPRKNSQYFPQWPEDGAGGGNPNNDALDTFCASSWAGPGGDVPSQRRERGTAGSVPGVAAPAQISEIDRLHAMGDAKFGKPRRMGVGGLISLRLEAGVAASGAKGWATASLDLIARRRRGHGHERVFVRPALSNRAGTQRANKPGGLASPALKGETNSFHQALLPGMRAECGRAAVVTNASGASRDDRSTPNPSPRFYRRLGRQLVNLARAACPVLDGVDITSYA
ncbi:hypothetical protein T492DRAFT_1148159 [Pavlovales sp. CCMP2436]|nr:hypothetical protein T492DRAFT_1148159 [Pavlovales sp. CCMP2436]